GAPAFPLVIATVGPVAGRILTQPDPPSPTCVRRAPVLGDRSPSPPRDGSPMEVRARAGPSVLAMRHEPEPCVDLARGFGEVERVEVQPGHASLEQIAAELGRDVDSALTDLGAVIATRFDPLDDVDGDGVAGELGHPLDRDE